MKRVKITKQNLLSIGVEIGKVFEKVYENETFAGFDFSTGDYRRKNLKKPKNLVLTKSKNAEDSNPNDCLVVYMEQSDPGFNPKASLDELSIENFGHGRMTPVVSFGDVVLIDNLNVHIISHEPEGRRYYSFVAVKKAS